MRSIDIAVGTRFGRLVVQQELDSPDRYRRFKFICDCGNTTIAMLNSVRTKHTQSCGCLKTEMVTSHSMTKTHEYRSWSDMKTRCYNPRSKNYKNYGGRGITVCNGWMLSFVDFVADVGKAPTNKHQIERIENNGNYEPSNCKWATAKEQNGNKRTNVWVLLNEERVILSEAASRIGFTAPTLSRWLRKTSQTICGQFSIKLL